MTPSTPRPLDVGRRLAGVRLERGLSQGTLARMARVAPSYLSRVETGRVQPTVRTLGRIASALGVPLASLLADGGGRGCRHPPCPVTTSGECLLDLIRPAAAPASAGQESYTPRQARLLRRVGVWLRTLDEESVAAVEVLVGRALQERGLVPAPGARRERPARAGALSRP